MFAKLAEFFNHSIRKLTGIRSFSVNMAVQNPPEDSLKRYKAIIDSSREGFLLVDIKGNILEVNAAYAKMIGYSMTELLKTPILQLLPSEYVSHIQPHIHTIFSQGHDQFELHQQHKRTFA